MAGLIVHRILLFVSIFAFANAAKCSRSSNAITCENVDMGVIERLAIYYVNEVNLIVRNSSIPVLETGMFRELKFLGKLCLTRCGIRTVNDGVFQGLNLTHLNLARNSISEISENIFVDLPNLKYLDLSHNVISRLELRAEVGYLPELGYVDVSNNRLMDFNLVGNFSQLETINFGNNRLRKFQIDYILSLPKVREVFFGRNLFNKSYESFATFTLVSSDVKIDFKNSFFDEEWNARNTSTNTTTTPHGSTRSSRRDIERDFKLSPELIKSLSPSQLTSLVERILILRNFTMNERNMLEIERKRIQNESKNVKNELTRIDQILKRFNEVDGQAKQESVGEYIEESCKGMPEDSWWQRFKKWKCKKLFNWVKRLISR